MTGAISCDDFSTASLGTTMSARNRNWLMTLSLVFVLSEAIADDVTQNAASGPRCGDGTPRGDSFCAADEHAALTEQLEELH